MASRIRQLYQSDLLYVGPTGNQGITYPATGALSSTGSFGNILAGISGVNFIAQLHRIQKVDDSWSRKLTNVNQIGQLAAIDRITIEQPTVNLNISWIQNNMVNENLIGLTISKAGDSSLVSCISGILAGITEPLNYFNKITSEGTDAISLNPANYDVISMGNAFIESYTANGRVGDFPTVDVSLRALNMQAQNVVQSAGATTPAVNPSSGTPIGGWGYILPTGVISFNNQGISNSATFGISALRPGDIQLNLGLNVGDSLVDPNDIKVQNYSLSIPFNREDLLKLGSKYAYAIVPRFPLDVSLSVEAIVGNNATGMLTEIVNNNNGFNPSITINQPGTNTPCVYYKLGNAKLQDNTFSQANSATYRTVRMTFVTQIGGPSDLNNGVFMSGITVL